MSVLGNQHDRLTAKSLDVRAGVLRLEIVVAIAVMALLACGSLTPFTLDPRYLEGRPWRGLSWPGVSLEDAVSNVCVYLPVGGILALFGCRRLSRLPAVALATLGGLGVSIGLESMQTVIATRYPSWNDVILNGIGALLGGALTLAAWPRARMLADRVVHSVRWLGRWGWPADVTLTVVWFLAVAATCINGVEGVARILHGHASLQITLLPLIDYFYVPFVVAMTWVGELVAVYAVLTGTSRLLAMRLRTRGWGRGLWIVGVSAGAAVLGLIQAHGRVSISDVLLAVLTIGTVWCLVDVLSWSGDDGSQAVEV